MKLKSPNILKITKNLFDRPKIRQFLFLYIFFLHFTFLNNINSQDIHFTQIYYSPLVTNPANTGNFDGNWRFVNNYRNQWKAISIPFRTIAVSYDKIFYIFTEKFSYGINVIDDKSGNINLKVNKIFLSFAYHKQIDFNIFHFGIQCGYVFKNFSTNNITFPSQFDMSIGLFNSQLPNNETNLKTSINYPDINFGGIWERKYGKIKPIVGMCLNHLTFANESFLGEKNNLPLKYSIFSSLDINIKSFHIVPSIFRMSQRKATDFIGGIELKQELKSLLFRKIYCGFYNRNDFKTANDALIFLIGIQVKQCNFAVSYDINVSPLAKATNNRGAFEFSVIYTSKSLIPNKITMPCERI
ncbi:MAG: PorP/SprF family type IX secretion system membrane protein [Bacteroidales bacterium]|nr:PorP/SprF family type IX secretion system membrane protein [Bacteroidales bacterium]